MKQKINQHVLYAVMLALFAVPVLAQDSTMSMNMQGNMPASGNMMKKSFSTFSIGINAGVLAPVVPIGGSNDYTKWKPTFGYGAYIKNQFTHYLALQADFLKGTLKATNENALGDGRPTTNPYSSFKTDLDWSASLSAVVTFGNINWMSDKNFVVPYVSVGGGLVSYKPKIVSGGQEISYKANDGNIKEFYVPVGAGLRITASQAVNVDLGFRMNFVDADNLDGYNAGPSKDKFTYGFAGLEFAFGSKQHPQLISNNPVSDLKMDLWDQNNALKTSVNSSLQQSQTTIDSLNAQISKMKMDSDKDGVSDYFDKCPNTPDSVKVDGAGCALPKMAPPPPPAPATIIITEEDRRIVSDAIKNLEFETGKSTIRDKSYPSLDRVAEILVKKNFSLKLAGHTDDVGSDANNLRLSKDRAESVKEYLVSKGANSSRIEATGYGESQPIASNKTAAGRQKNRRVEFTLF